MRKKVRNRLIITIFFLIVLLFIFIFGKFKFTIVSDTETQLKSEYTTRWANKLDADITSSQSFGNSGENDKFTWSGSSIGNVVVTPDGEMISIFGNLNDKKDYYGQEVVVLVRYTEGNSNINGLDIFGGLPEGDYIVTLVPRTLDLSKVDVFFNSPVPKATLNVQKPFYINFAGQPRMIINYIGYKAQFSCDLSPNERWIQTQWIGSVSVDDIIKKDGFIPTKFCKETRPFVLRDINQGETAIVPDPIPDFNRGCYIPNTGDCKTPAFLPTNQFIVVNYAVYQVAGLENPTTGTQAYKCIQRDSNYKCLGWAIEEVIKPVEVVVQCKVNSDCPLPLTQFQDTSCLNYFKGCQANKCVYDNTILEAPKCQNQVVTIVKQIQEIEKTKIIPITGTNIFTFTQNKDRSGSFNIGDKTFSASIPLFTCSSSSDIISLPSPSSDCWKTKINYGNKGGGDLFHNQKLVIDGLVSPATNKLVSLIEVQYFASGTYVINSEFKQANDETSFRNDDWGNLFVFTLDLDNAFIVEGTYGESVLKDSEYSIQFDIINNLPKSDVLVKINQKVKSTNQNLPEVIINNAYNNGVNKFNHKLNTQNLGLNNVLVDIYYKITADKENLIEVASIPLTYNIVTELPSVDKIVVIEKEKIIEKDKIIEINKIPFYIWYIIGFLIFIIIILIILSRRKRK